MKESVVGVFGDIGSCREGLPALRLLQERGIIVKYFVSAEPQAKAGTEVLAKAGIQFETRDPQLEDKPKAIIIGTSSTAVQAQIKWTSFGKEKGIPVIWVEDLWGCGEWMQTRSVSPNVICTLDEIAKKIVLIARPDIRVEVVGKPTFGNFVKYIPVINEFTSLMRKLICERAGVDEEGAIVVTYSSGGNPERVKAQLEALRDLDALIDRKVIFVPRLHPTFLNRDEFKKLAHSGNKLVVNAYDLNLDELFINSSLIIGEWGTTGMYTGALFGVPGIMCLFPDDTVSRSALYPDGIPPLLIAGAGWSAENPCQLRERIQWIFSHKEEAEAQVREKVRVFAPLLEAGASERIAKVIEEFL